MPADGYVKDKIAYESALAQGLEACDGNGSIVLVGVRPTYPATGYGYILVDPDKHVPEVLDFTEKPTEEEAKKMSDSGRYLWNGGILLGELDVIINRVRQYLPWHFEKIGGAVELLGKPGFEAALEAAYSQITDVSFDVGVLEKMKDSGSLCAVQGRFDWDDIGSLDALAKILDTGGSGNVALGNHCGLDTEGCVIYGKDGIMTATIGLRNTIVAVTGDAVLVAPRERAQEVKQLVEKLKKNGFEKYV